MSTDQSHAPNHSGETSDSILSPSTVPADGGSIVTTNRPTVGFEGSKAAKKHTRVKHKKPKGQLSLWELKEMNPRDAALFSPHDDA